MVELPVPLINAVQDQNAVLFLGAEASYGAVHPQQKKIPTGVALRDFLSDRFLGGARKEIISCCG